MFTFVPESEFGEDQIAEHPVWARYYEPDELDEVASWGIDRDEFLKGLREVHDGSDHAMYPVLRTDPLPDCLDLYVRAHFVTPDGQVFGGYTCGDDPGYGFVVSLFYANETYTFSSSGLATLNMIELTRLRNDMKRFNAQIFPLRYSTGFRKSDGTEHCGLISPTFP